MSFDSMRFVAIDELRELFSRVDSGSVDDVVDAVSSVPRVYSAGAGRSGLVMRGFAMRLMHMGIESYVVGDATTPAFGAGDLLVIGSGSGNTASLRVTADKAKSLGGRVVLLTTDGTSRIGAIADLVVDIPASSPKAEPGAQNAVRSIQPMANLFEQSLWLVLDTVVALLMERMNLTSERMFERHANLE
jgi:6-phospho-3-hexuloisomerase